MNDLPPALANLPYLAKSDGPAWLPAAAADGRRFAYYGHLLLYLMLLISAIAGVVSLAALNFSGVMWLIFAAVCALLIFLMNNTVFEPIDQGRFKEASDHLLMWGVIGLIFCLVVPGLFFLIAFIRMQEALRPQSQQQYPTQYYQRPPEYPQHAPPAYQQPAPQHQAPAPAAPAPAAPAPVAPAPEPAQANAGISKCAGCGNEYPSFMRNCPSCGRPK